MKSLAALLAVVATAAVCEAQITVPPAPVIDPLYTQAPVASVHPLSPMAPPYVAAAPQPLFHAVKYKDKDEMAPCAVPKIIAVKDPCHDDDSCCAPACVYIQICVPPNCCEEVKCRRNGDRVRYDYGEYAVDVRVKRGYIEVDYQD